MRVISGAGTPVKTLLHPGKMTTNLFHHGPLIRQFTRRDIESRYRGSFLGMAWSLLTPLLMLAVYTFVFSTVLKGRWDRPGIEAAAESKSPPFALVLLCGLLVYNFFSEVIGRSPGLIVANPNLVKKVVFPLEILPLSAVLVGVFNMVFMLLVWVAGALIFVGAIPATAILLPIILLPTLLATAGFAWFLASLGVFVRDTAPTVLVIVQILFFATPIMYPLDIVPAPYDTVLRINPLTTAVENVRNVLLWGELPNWGMFVGSLAATSMICLLGYAFFMKSKRAFGDVL
jgi:lipopolysaccharide transport system permease protein